MEFDTMTIILIAVIAVMLLILHIIYGVVAGHIAGRKGRGTVRNFWLGFFLGLIGILIAELRPAKSFMMNPNIKNELMYIAWLRQCGALSDEEFEREKKILYYMNHYM